ncbi:MAG: hypothetical protein HYX92_22165 [Chloroflexi bacterium]|nr:hypothetical protein [Chloroflexota bacterium]
MFQLPAGYDRDSVSREAIFDEEGRWVASTLNRSPLVTGGLLPTRVIIHDDTLRSGANTPGVYITNDKRMRIAEKLEETGVRDIEAGYAGLSDHCEFFRMLKKAGTRMRLGAHTMAMVENYRKEIYNAVEGGADVINIVAQFTEIGKNQFGGLPESVVVERIHDSVGYAKGLGVMASIGTVADSLEAIQKALHAAVDAGADRIYVYDARGWYTPNTVSFLVRLAKDIVGSRAQVAFHGHDDYGLATANSLEAVRAGADVVDVTVNRSGHRCGNASFEQVVAALTTIYGIDTGVELGKVFDLCKLVEELFEVGIPPNSPHVGAYMYLYAGAKTNAILRGDWFVWENIKAEAMGQKRGLQWTAHALERGGTKDAPVAIKAQQMGVNLTEEQLAQVYGELRKVFAEKKVATDPELEALISRVVKG